MKRTLSYPPPVARLAPRAWSTAVVTLAILLHGAGIAAAAGAEATTPATTEVSFYKQVRPLFQAQCQGCHQPAKAKGGYVMTEFDRLQQPGESGKKPIVPGKPDESLLVQQITPQGGEAEMPRGKDPLHPQEIELVRQWIAQGARDDTPANARERYDLDHPPVYTRQPVITALDFAPDGRLLAVSGFHEVLLHRADGSGLEARLIGLSERIQSVRFSPDGTRLAVAGGQPGRMGEIQIWDVAKRTLLVSAPFGYDTLYGASWSPDGRRVAFGAPDKILRALDATSGKQVLQQGSHNDWVLDTVFTAQGTHIVSVGRDMSAKLTEVASQRFVDNITSITPGALRGGIHAVARHPQRDEVLVGGADGVPQIFQVFRQAARKIGDNATLLRRFPEMEGRIFSVAYSPTGDRIVAGASLDGVGTVNIYDARFDSTIPAELLKAYEKTAGGYSKEEREAIERFVTADIALLHTVRIEPSAIYGVAFSPDGKWVAAAGQDGTVRLIDAVSGWIERAFPAAPAIAPAPAAPDTAPALAQGSSLPTGLGTQGTNAAAAEVLPPNTKVSSLDLQPAKPVLNSRNEHIQFIVSARLQNGDLVDVTRFARFETETAAAEVSPTGRFTAHKPGKVRVTASFGGRKETTTVDASRLESDLEADFVRDVNPILSKLGCNAGTCHGAKDGKNGFKLSLRGYDPVFDVRAFTDDHAARRINLASPDDSLMLLKATGAVPHEGGQRTPMNSEYYAVLRQWIASGARFDAAAARVTRIEVFPKNPIVQALGARQQMRVLATYADGRVRDVTSEAFIETGNADVATTDATGLVQTLRRGEAPVLARYEGNYDATTVTVMGDRAGFVWKEPPAHNRIDSLVAAKWKRLKILPSDLCDDHEFVRRVYLDLTGLPPGAEEVRRFAADPAPTRAKREALIERLLGSPDYVDHWANKWADLLQVNRKFLGTEGAQLFRDWIRGQVETNTPYNVFVERVLTASGSNRENPPAGYFKTLRTPTDTMENTTHLFLATRFNCNKCHDHPFERWTQDQYYQMAAFFARVELKKDDASGDKKIGGTAVEGAKPLYEIVGDATTGEIKHDRTQRITPPVFPYPAGEGAAKSGDNRRAQLAAWITSPDNRYFASSYVNRLWGYLTGVGLIEPIDDTRAGNPPSNPELLAYLTEEFVRSGFDTRHMLRLITQSRTYQLSLATHRWNEDDRSNYSHALPRRLPAEVLLDSVYKVTGSTPAIPGTQPGTRAAQLPDSGLDLPSGFLATLGRPARESSCECERSNDIRLGSIMTLLSGPTVSGAVNDPQNAIARLVESESDDRKVIDEVFHRVLNRPPGQKETEAALAVARELDAEYAALTNKLATAEAAWTVERARLETQRTEAIVKAEAALAAHLTARAPQIAAAERQRQERIAAAEQPVRDYEAMLPTLATAWEDRLASNQLATAWIPIDPKDIVGEGGARLERAPGNTIRSLGSRGSLPDYVITAETSLTNITGVKLEVLTADEAPGFGPGFAAGNFFLSEFIVQAAPKTNATAFAGLRIATAATDYIESGLDLIHTFDGKSEQGLREGWAIGGGEGAPHWAAFALDKPQGHKDGSVLKFIIQHRYQAPFEIARFKLWITTSPTPTQAGLPEDIIETLRTPAVTRLPEQTSRILAFYRQLDAEMRRRQQALVTARQPLPEDVRLKELELELARATRPVLTDPTLVQLRQDVEASARQLDRRRLTAAQDLAWALINTPAFLFNR